MPMMESWCREDLVMIFSVVERVSEALSISFGAVD
jgi:hypothetical protein